MATTTNYGWTTPDDTALVKDGAAAIRTLGSSVDTTTKNLNPSTTLGDIEYRSSTANTNTRLAIGTSGQALTVVAGAPSWAASPTSVLTTTGDTLYASAANTLARLGIGSTNQVLTVAGGVPTWATPAASGMTLITTLSPSAVASSSVDNVFTSTYDSYLIVGFITWTDNTNFEMRLRASGSDITTSTYFADTTAGQGSAGSTYYLADNRGTNVITGFTIGITNPGNSSYKMGNVQRTFNATTGVYYSQSFRNSTLSATDGIKFFPTTGTMTGTIRIYGLAK